MSGLALERTFLGHTDWVWCIAVHGDTVVSGSDDYTAKVWSRSQNELLATYNMHRWGIRAVDLIVEPNGDLIAVTGSVDETIQVWRVDTGEVLQKFVAPATVISVAVTGDFIAGGLLTGTVLVCSRKSGAIEQRYESLHNEDVDRITAWDDYIVTAGADSLIKVISISQEKVLHTLKFHKRTVHGIAVVPTPSRPVIVSAGSDMWLATWDLQTGQQLAKVELRSGVCSMCVSRQKNIIITGGGGGIGGFTFPKLECLWRNLRGGGTVETLFADGDVVVSGTRSHVIKTWQIGYTLKEYVDVLENAILCFPTALFPVIADYLVVVAPAAW